MLVTKRLVSQYCVLSSCALGIYFHNMQVSITLFFFLFFFFLVVIVLLKHLFLGKEDKWRIHDIKNKDVCFFEKPKTP